MTYCVGIKLRSGLILGSDSRTHAEVDNFATFCKMSVFERPGDRAIVLLSSGSLAGTQAVITLLRQRGGGPAPNVWSVRSMFDLAMLVSDAMRDVDRRDGPYVSGGIAGFNGSFILGGQIRGDEMRLFRLYAEGNFIEASTDTPFFQTGEAKYGKPIIDRVIAPDTTLGDAIKCVLISFDSTMRSNLSVGMPIDLACYERDSLCLRMRRRVHATDADYVGIRDRWNAGTRRVFRELPDLAWKAPPGEEPADPPMGPGADVPSPTAAAAPAATPAPAAPIAPKPR